MPHAMTVSWRCDLCGTKGRLIFDTAVPPQQAYVDVFSAHGLILAALEQPSMLAHANAIHFQVRIARTPTTQKSLFE